jgi:hypothetical protein
MTEQEAAHLAWRRIRPSFNRRLSRVLADAAAFREELLEQRGSVQSAAARESDYADWMARRFFQECLDIWTEVLQRPIDKAFCQGVFTYCLVPFFADRQRWFPKEFRRQKKIRKVSPELINQEIRNHGDRMFALQRLWRNQLDSYAFDAQRKARINRTKAGTKRSKGRTVIDSLADSAVEESEVAAEPSTGAVAEEPQILVAAGPVRPRGRRPKRERVFVTTAGRLWKAELQRSPGRQIDGSGLRRITQELDRLGFGEPADFLEGAALRVLKDFNSRHSTSTPGPIRTWTELADRRPSPVYPDPKTKKKITFISRLRRLLSRCAAAAEK